MTCAPEVVARLYVRGLLPTSIARGLFWRLANESTCVQHAAVDATIAFPGGALDLHLPLSSRSNWLMLFKGVEQSEDAGMLREFCRRAATAGCILDIGTNAGLYTYHAATSAPASARIVGVEANAALVAMVNDNLARNRVANAEIVHAAATSARGSVSFHLGVNDQISSVEASHLAEHGGITDSIEVPAIPVDDLVAERSLAPDLVKLDVEGHELDALKGMQDTLTRHRPALIVEVKATTIDRVDSLLTGVGYRGRKWKDDRVLVDDLSVDTEDHANFLYEPVG